MIVKKQRQKHSEVAHNFYNRYQDNTQLQKPQKQKIDASIKSTRDKIDSILNIKKQAAFGTNIQKLGNTTSQTIKFTSKGQTTQSQQQRVARIDSVQIDPLMPPLHKHRKLPKGQGSPPPQILRSPPRKLTKKDMDDWKIPPCISNWKNSKGYTIPIHMRLGADGRSLQHNTINQAFADNIDTIYVAEREHKLRLDERSKVQKSLQLKQHLKKQEALKQAAKQARQEKQRIMEQQSQDSQDDEYLEREEFRKHRRRQLQRQERLKKVGVQRKKQIKKDQRDISQKIALGQAQPTNQDLMFDQRLYDKTGGLQAGNSDSQDDNLYTKPLFTDRNALHTGLAGNTSKDGLRTEPVRFQQHKQSVFGMDGLLGKPQKRVKKDTE